MLKAFLVGLAFSVSSAAAYACEIREDQSRSVIVDYVSDGLRCLDAPPHGYRFDEAVEIAFVQKINAERTDRGLSALSIRRALQPAARYQSLDMAMNNFFDHQSPDGRRAAQRIAAFDRTLLAQSTGENLAVFGPARCYDMDDNEVTCFELPGFELPTAAFVAEDLHQKLMDSEGHRANILSEDFTHLAIGVARTDTGFYVTQLFANRVGSLTEPLATEFEVNAPLALKPNIAGWDMGGYIIADPGGEETKLKSDRLKGLAAGEKRLIVVGKNVIEGSRGSSTYVLTEWLNLSGPSFTLRDAKGS